MGQNAIWLLVQRLPWYFYRFMHHIIYYMEAFRLLRLVPVKLFSIKLSTIYKLFQLFINEIDMFFTNIQWIPQDRKAQQITNYIKREKIMNEYKHAQANVTRYYTWLGITQKMSCFMSSNPFLVIREEWGKATNGSLKKSVGANEWPSLVNQNCWNHGIGKFALDLITLVKCSPLPKLPKRCSQLNMV